MLFNKKCNSVSNSFAKRSILWGRGGVGIDVLMVTFQCQTALQEIHLVGGIGILMVVFSSEEYFVNDFVYS